MAEGGLFILEKGLGVMRKLIPVKAAAAASTPAASHACSASQKAV